MSLTHDAFFALPKVGPLHSASLWVYPGTPRSTLCWLPSSLFLPPLSPLHLSLSSQVEQAELVWQGVFVDRCPVSEASRGVLTSLRLLGLGDLVAARDLPALRAWFREQDPAEHVERVFQIAKIK